MAMSPSVSRMPARVPGAAQAPGPAAAGPANALRSQLRGVGFAAGQAMLAPGGAQAAAQEPAGLAGLAQQLTALGRGAGAGAVERPAEADVDASPAPVEAEVAAAPKPQVGAEAGSADTAVLDAPIELGEHDPGPAGEGAPEEPLEVADAATPGAGAETPAESAPAEAEASGGGAAETDASASGGGAEAAAGTGAGAEAAAGPGGGGVEAEAAGGGPAVEAAQSQGAATEAQAPSAVGAAAGHGAAVAPDEAAVAHLGGTGSPEQANEEAGSSDQEGAAAELQARLEPRDAGSPLPMAAREHLEADIGVDLGDVRVHQGGAPGATLGQLGAPAAAMGKHILLRDAGADLAAPATLKVLRHEAMHLVQQAQGQVDEALGDEGHDGRRADLERAADAPATPTNDDSSLERVRPDAAPAGSVRAGAAIAEAAGPASARPGEGGRRRRSGRSGPGRGQAPRKIALRARGPAQYLGLPSPRDVYNKVKKTGDRAARATANKARAAVGWAGDKAKKGYTKLKGLSKVLANRLRGAITNALSAAGSYLMGKLESLRSRLWSLDTLKGLLERAGFSEAAAFVDRAKSLGERAVSELADARKRAAQAAAAVRQLRSLVSQYRRKGPAYYNAAKAAVTRTTRVLSDPGTLFKRGRAAVRAAVAEVRARALKAFAAARAAVAAPLQTVGTALSQVGPALKSAGQWMAARRSGFRDIFDGVTSMLSLLPPPVGPVSALANALLKAAEGDWRGAGTSLLTAIPLVGHAARAGSYGTRAQGHVVKLDGYIKRTRSRAQSLQGAAAGRLERLRGVWRGAQQRLSQGAAQVRSRLAARLAPLQRRYFDMQPRLTAYSTRVMERIARVRERFGPAYKRYQGWNTKFTRAEKLWGTIRSAGGDILSGLDEVMSPTPAT